MVDGLVAEDFFAEAVEGAADLPLAAIGFHNLTPFPFPTSTGATFVISNLGTDKAMYGKEYEVQIMIEKVQLESTTMQSLIP